MKIGLAAVGFKDRDIEYNKNKIISLMKQYSKNIDMLVFGESFLQGFEVLSWNYSEDVIIAKQIDDECISNIRDAAKQYDIAVSFGFIEKEIDKNELHSTQITIGSNGEIVNLFRRVSIGWKEEPADEHYTEGSQFSSFLYKNVTFSVGLCGDFWYDDNADIVKKMKTDVVLWPVYTDYNVKEWNEEVRYEYAKQAEKVGKTVLLVNSVCLNVKNDETAKGGASKIVDGNIEEELLPGKEGVLIICL